MRQSYGRNLLNDEFDVMTVDAVWQKGTIVAGVNPNLIRKDSNGFWIERYNYADITRGGTGWEIGHIVSISDGGGDHLGNLQPLQWQNNRSRTEHLDSSRDCDLFAAGHTGSINEEYLALDELRFE